LCVRSGGQGLFSCVKEAITILDIGVAINRLLPNGNYMYHLHFTDLAGFHTVETRICVYLLVAIPILDIGVAINRLPPNGNYMYHLHFSTHYFCVPWDLNMTAIVR